MSSYLDNFRSGYLIKGTPLGALSKSHYVTADNTAIPTSETGWISLDSDSATATSRTITLAASGAGYVQFALTDQGSTFSPFSPTAASTMWSNSQTLCAIATSIAIAES